MDSFQKVVKNNISAALTFGTQKWKLICDIEYLNSYFFQRFVNDFLNCEWEIVFMICAVTMSKIKLDKSNLKQHRAVIIEKIEIRLNSTIQRSRMYLTDNSGLEAIESTS